MTMDPSATKIGPGQFASARFLSALAALALTTGAGAGPAWAQARQQQPTAAAATPVPDQTTLSKLLWSTMAAVDQANKTGNYSVLRDLGSAGFQANNNAATLAGVFAQIRAQRVDLSDTLLLAPTYEFDPAIVGPNLLRMRGTFNMRPTGVGFDLLYVWDNGWRLHGVSIVPFTLARAAPQPR